MHVVTAGTSGICGPQNLNASPVHASFCAAVPWAMATEGSKKTAETMKKRIVDHRRTCRCVKVELSNSDDAFYRHLFGSKLDAVSQARQEALCDFAHCLVILAFDVPVSKMRDTGLKLVAKLWVLLRDEAYGAEEEMLNRQLAAAGIGEVSRGVVQERPTANTSRSSSRSDCVVIHASSARTRLAERSAVS